MALHARKNTMDLLSASNEKDIAPNVDRPLRIIINGIHSKSGGGVTYLRKILPILGKMQELEIHLFIHKNQFDLFYPVDENINVNIFSYKEEFFRTLIWEQIAIPIKAWAIRADAVFSPANFGPIFAKNHVILLRNAVSVIKLTQNPRTVLYWLGLSMATFISFILAKKAIAVSAYAKKLLTFGLPERITNKCSVVHHGVDYVNSEENRINIRGEDLLAVSDIYVQKNYDTLIKAIALLVKRRPKIRLVIIGQAIDLHYLKKLEYLIIKLNVKDNIVFKGYVKNEEIISYYRNCRAFIFPSHIETFGNSLLEAMASGAAIACSRTAAMPEIIGEAGLFYDPNNEHDMANKIELLLENDELRKDLGDLAFKRASNFQWAKTAQETINVLIEAAQLKSTVQKRPL